jgi:hypothetical protein
MPSPDAGDDFPGSQVETEPRLFIDVGAETVADGIRPEVTMGTGNNKNRVQVNENLLNGGIALAIVGLFLLAAGTVLGGSAFWYAGRRWLRGLEKAPSEAVKVMLGQLGNAASAGAKAASEAGAKAWKDGAAAA